MVTLTASSPDRHGTCRLQVLINAETYTLRRVKGSIKGARVWSLRSITGARAGAVYSVAVSRGVVACTCPDTHFRGEGLCKHVGALRALGLIGRNIVPASPQAPKGGAR